ncbi:MAG: glycosyltransferase family 29 protein [Marinosulfonomonas sp.]|nr:glycosyltransferase family 29 protein [Marinosulfonomonas sp.]
MALADRARHWRASRHPEGNTGQKWFGKNCQTEHDLYEQIAGKNVALVGNARALMNTRQGDQIDSYDFVVRMNHAPSLGTVAGGARFDWLATSIRPVHHSVKNCLWMGQKLKRMPYSLAVSGNLYLYPFKRRQIMSEILGARASTGVMLIDFMLNSPARKISLFGFDFFETLSLSGDQDKETAPHDFLSEADWVAAKMQKDGRLTLVSMA